MYQTKLDINTLEEYILGSLKITREDAPSLGGFCCAVIELLGRFLRIHQISKGRKGKDYYPHNEWFYDFIENYLKNKNIEYFERRYILWKILRCESAHCIMSPGNINFSNADWIKNYHLKGHLDPRGNKKSLLIWTSKLADDLSEAVSDFFNDVRKNPTLEDNCQKTFLEIYNKGRDIINKENIRIDITSIIIKG